MRNEKVRELEPPGCRLSLGAQPDARYENAVVELRPGDVVFSPDGPAEAPALPRATPGHHLAAPAAAGELFGFDRLQRSATHRSAHAESAEAVAAGNWADLTAWCGEESHHDDVTLLVLRVPE